MRACKMKLKKRRNLHALYSLIFASFSIGCSTTAPPARHLKLAWQASGVSNTLPAVDQAEPVNAETDAAKNRAIFFTKEKAPRPVVKKVGAAGRHGENGNIDLQFRDADIHAVIDAILGEELKLDYTIAPAVQGKITLRTRKPLTKEALLPALEAALHSVSATIIEQDGAYHVIPLDAAQQWVKGVSQVRAYGPISPGFAVEILPLKYIPAREMQNILEAVVPKGTVLQADDVHNHLVIAGSSQDRAAVQQTVEGFDVDWLEGMNFALYQVENSSPSQIITELKEIFQPPIGVIGSRVRFVGLDRIHSILGIARDRSDLELIEDWIKRLDVTKTSERRVFVYNVQNGNAKDLAKALRQLLGEKVGSEQTNTDTTSPLPTGTEGYGPDGLSMEKSENRPLVGTVQGQGEGRASKLVAVEETNSLLYYGTEDEYRVIKDALQQLDIVPRQVMIEAILAEVTLNDSLRYGVQWFFDAGENTVTLSASDTGAIASLFPGFSYVYSGGADVRVVLNALQERTDVRVLSAPKLSVLNNQKAMLQVGDQVPIVTQTSQATISPNAPIVNQVQMRDTGVILEITPRINENGSLILDVSQEVSDVTQTTSSGIDSPTIQRRKIRTFVLTNDGFTVALGGLIRENGRENNSGLPFIKDIPIIGNLFRNNVFENRRTELIVLLVPHVMRNQAETRAVVDALLEGLNAAGQVTERAKPLWPSLRK
jgi:general secretion pathway protein D